MSELTLAQTNSYYIHITFKCNWYCDYCSEGTHTRPVITFDYIKEEVNKVPHGANVTISGGEPGIAKKEIVYWVFEQLLSKGCSISVNTNGLFFKKFPDLCDKVDNFLYHCSEHLDEDELYIPDVDQSKIDYLLVITDDTMHRLEYYVNKYSYIKFVVFGATETYYAKRGQGASLSRTNGFKIYKEYKDKINPISYMHLITRSQETISIQNITVSDKYSNG